MRYPRPQIRSGIAQEVVLCRLRRASANLACRVRSVMPVALPWCATIALMMASCVRKLEYGMPLGDLPSSSDSNPPTMFR